MKWVSRVLLAGWVCAWVGLVTNTWRWATSDSWTVTHDRLGLLNFFWWMLMVMFGIFYLFAMNHLHSKRGDSK